MSELIIHYYLSDRQNDSLIHLIPDYKDKVSSLSTEALLLHEDLKAQEVAGTAAEMANAGRKHSEYHCIPIPIYRVVLIPHT